MSSELGLQLSSQIPGMQNYLIMNTSYTFFAVFICISNIYFTFFSNTPQQTWYSIWYLCRIKTTQGDHFLLTLMSSSTLNSVSQISARWSMRSSACRPRIRSFRARQLGRKKSIKKNVFSKCWLGQHDYYCMTIIKGTKLLWTLT